MNIFIRINCNIDVCSDMKIYRVRYYLHDIQLCLAASNSVSISVAGRLLILLLLRRTAWLLCVAAVWSLLWWYSSSTPLLCPYTLTNRSDKVLPYFKREWVAYAIHPSTIAEMDSGHSVRVTYFEIVIAVYTVYCTLYTVHCTLYTVYTVHCIHCIHCTLYTVHCTLYTLYAVRESGFFDISYSQF